MKTLLIISALLLSATAEAQEMGNVQQQKASMGNVNYDLKYKAWEIDLNIPDPVEIKPVPKPDLVKSNIFSMKYRAAVIGGTVAETELQMKQLIYNLRIDFKNSGTPILSIQEEFVSILPVYQVRYFHGYEQKIIVGYELIKVLNIKLNSYNRPVDERQLRIREELLDNISQY